MNYQEAAREFKGALRLRTEPLGVAFLADAAALPEKTRRPSQVLGKKVTICQGVTMARVYGWPVGLTAEDLICVPGMLAFGLTPEPDPGQELVSLLCDVGFHADKEAAQKEVEALTRLGSQEIEALYLAPLERLARDPDVVVVYGNPAQLSRLRSGRAGPGRFWRQSGMQLLPHRSLENQPGPGRHARHGRPHFFHDPGR